jgi:outer membrane protein TolC
MPLPMPNPKPMKQARIPNQTRALCALPARLSLLTVALLAGCSIVPQAVTAPEVKERAQRDQQAMYAGQEAIRGPVGLEEAVARALKYNLDYRLKVMESALSVGIADVSRFEMLPKLVTSAGYSSRSSDSGGTSVNIATGAVSLEPSTSQERQRATAAADFSWNVLDFGISYYRARQQADQVLIAEERRRRVMQNILQDVRSAYWRAVGAQRLSREAAALSERARSALERSRDAEKQGLVPAREALNYQRLLLDSVALLATRRQELAYAKLELRALMSVPAGSDFTVVEADEPELRALPTDIAALEEEALRQRPELREEDYRVRVTALEARRQLLALLPGLNFSLGLQHDSNRYLANNSWVDSGAQVGLNLFKLLSLPALKQSQAAQVQADEARRMALSMAVVTQVRVAVERYRMSLQDLAVAKESGLVDQRLASYARAGISARADSELELIRAETRALNSAYQRYASFAATQMAFGRIVNSVGLQAVPVNLADASVADLSQQIGRHLQAVEGARFPQVATAANVLPPLRVRVLPPADGGADTSLVAAAVQQALTRNHFPAAAATGPAALLTMQLALQPVRDGLRRAEWTLQLQQPDGSQAGDTRYVSTLPATTTPRAMAAFGEAAAVANLPTLDQWLRAIKAP